MLSIWLNSNHFLSLFVLTIFAINFTFTSSIPREKSYDGYKLIQASVPSLQHQVAIKELKKLFKSDFVDFLETPRTTASLLIHSEAIAKVREFLANNSIEHKTIVEDFGRLIDEERDKNAQNDPKDLDKYHSYEEIIAYMKSVSLENTKFVKYGKIGHSYMGRELAYLKIGFPTEHTNKAAMFVDAGIHAREWITHAMALKFIDELVHNRSNLPMLKNIDIYVLPSLNPDGYEYSRNYKRMWRGTRSKHASGSTCIGVDPNRNFPYAWNTTGTSSNECDEDYAGPKPLSEIECRSLANFLKENNNSIRAYLTLHSYSDLIMYPYAAHHGVYPENVEELKRITNQMAQAIKQAGGDEYRTGAVPDVLYEAFGSSTDYATSIGIEYSIAMELTSGLQGFIYPEKHIPELAKQLIPAFMVLAKVVEKL